MSECRHQMNPDTCISCKDDKENTHIRYYDKMTKNEDRVDHICKLVDLEWNGSITRDELARRLNQLTDKWRKEDNAEKRMV